MIKNKLRQNEIDCLNKVKDNLINFMGIHKVFDNSDYSKIESILKSAKQNENHNNFPDFFFDGGIIEHFEVTAAEETHKGSKYKIHDACFQREKDKYFKDLDNEFLKSTYHKGTIRTEIIENTYKHFSYEYFVKSFKRNVEHHLDSLRKSKYVKSEVVFLIEQKSAILGVYLLNRFNRFYKLSEDRNILEYIKETLTDVSYIIFVAADRFEVIDLAKINFLILKAKTDLDIRGGRKIYTALKNYIDI